jgi:hypothetical protein
MSTWDIKKIFQLNPDIYPDLPLRAKKVGRHISPTHIKFKENCVGPFLRNSSSKFKNLKELQFFSNSRICDILYVRNFANKNQVVIR